MLDEICENVREYHYEQGREIGFRLGVCTSYVRSVRRFVRELNTAKEMISKIDDKDQRLEHEKTIEKILDDARKDLRYLDDIIFFINTYPRLSLDRLCEKIMLESEYAYFT